MPGSKAIPANLRADLRLVAKCRRTLPTVATCYASALVRACRAEIEPRRLPYGWEGGALIPGRRGAHTITGVAGQVLVAHRFNAAEAIASLAGYEGSFWCAVRVNLWRAMLDDPLWCHRRDLWQGRTISGA